MKTGKRPFVADARDLMFASYRTGAPLPPHPKTFGHGALVKSWGMLGNDRLGLCGQAMMAHWLMLLAAETGVPIDVTTESVIRLYSDVTGYNPADPDSDQGTVLRDLLKYMRTTGFVDAAGKTHKIEAFVRLDHTNMNELEEAMYLFGGIMIGVQLPDSAQTQFSDGKPWSYVAGSAIDGGHAILGAGMGGGKPVGFIGAVMETLGLSTPDMRVITWGANWPATQNFIRHTIDEAWACVSLDAFKNGKTIDGWDGATMLADLRAVAA